MSNISFNGLSNSKVGTWREFLAPLFPAILLIVSSIRYIGSFAPILFFAALIICCMAGRRSSAVATLLILYLPNAAVHIPNIIIISDVVILLCNIKSVRSVNFSLCKKLIIISAIFVLIRFLSFPFCEDTELFNFYFRYSALGLFQILLFCILIQNKEDAQFVLRWWCIIGVLCLICGFIHFSFRGDVYLTSMMSDKNEAMAQKGIIEYSSGWVRWIWATAEPNYLGVSLLIPFSVSSYFLFNKYSIVNLVLWIACFLAVFGTFSRASLLASFLIIILFLLTRKIKYKVLLIGLSVLVIFSIFYFFPDFFDRFQSIDENLATRGGSGRFSLWKEGFNIFLSSPVLGVGTGQEALYSASKIVCHNTLIQLISENGIFAVIIVFVFLKYVLKIAFSFKQESSLFAITLIGVLINMMTVSIYDLRIYLSFVVVMIISYSYEDNCYQNNITLNDGVVIKK